MITRTKNETFYCWHTKNNFYSGYIILYWTIYKLSNAMNEVLKTLSLLFCLSFDQQPSAKLADLGSPRFSVREKTHLAFVRSTGNIEPTLSAYKGRDLEIIERIKLIRETRLLLRTEYIAAPTQAQPEENDED